MRFPAKKNAPCPKAPRDFPPRKYGIVYPRRVDLGLPSPSHRVCADGRIDVRTDGNVTITSQPKFLGLIGYQISLAKELRWRALPAGSANKQHRSAVAMHADLLITNIACSVIRLVWCLLIHELEVLL